MLVINRTIIVFAPQVQPACLPYRFLGQSFDWQKITLAGWGYGSSNGSLTKILQKIDLTLIPVDACREFFAGYSVSIAPSKQVCAYQLPAGGKGSCYGDSGLWLGSQFQRLVTLAKRSAFWFCGKWNCLLVNCYRIKLRLVGSRFRKILCHGCSVLL